MTLKLPRLGSIPIADKDGKATREFSRFWDTAMSLIETNINDISLAQAAANTANAAAATANAAAATADAAATTAQTAATTANTVATTVTKTTNLANSYVTGLTLTAADAGANCTITISGNVRVYADGTSVVCSGGSLTALAYSTTYYVYYDDPARTGGAVTYASTTTYATAFATVANPDRHYVGGVKTPAALGPVINGIPMFPGGFNIVP